MRKDHSRKWPMLPLPRFRVEPDVLSDKHPAQLGGTRQKMCISSFRLPILNRCEDIHRALPELECDRQRNMDIHVKRATH